MTGQTQRILHLVRWQLDEARSQRVLWILSGVALAVALSGPMLRSFHFGADEPRFHAGIALLALWGAGTLLPALLAPLLVGQAGESRLLHCLRARGVGNGEWVLAVFAVIAAVQGWLILLVGAATTTNLMRHGQGSAVLTVCTQIAAQSGGLLVLAAMAVLLAAIFRRATAASGATVAFGLSMQMEPLFGRMAGATKGFTSMFWRGLDLLVPGATVVDGAGGLWATLGATGYCLVYLGLATAIHAQRED
jgi:hypothetical protein